MSSASKPPAQVSLTPPDVSLPAVLGNSGVPENPKDASKDDRSRLEALRAVLEGILDNPETSPRDIATVSREYRQCITALSALAPAAAGTKLDELRVRREQRGAL